MVLQQSKKKKIKYKIYVETGDFHIYFTALSKELDTDFLQDTLKDDTFHILQFMHV